MAVKKIKDDKRKFSRHTIEFVVSIYNNGKLISPNNSFKYISLNGALLLISNDHDFKRGDKFILLIEDEKLMREFNLILDPIEVEEKHFEKDNENLVGVSFVNITDKNKRIIQKLIDNKFLLKNFPKSWQITK